MKIEECVDTWAEKTGAHARKIELPRLSSRGRSWKV